MAKKDTYLALLRRGIDDTTANQLADAGLKIGDLKKIDKTMLVENYGLKEEIAQGVIEIITAGPQSHGKERFLSKVLAPEKKQESRIEEMKFQRKQKDVLAELAEQKERLKIAKVEAFRAQKLIMNRLGQRPLNSSSNSRTTFTTKERTTRRSRFETSSKHVALKPLETTKCLNLRAHRKTSSTSAASMCPG